jgi:predicted nucleotidyltransferase
MKKMTKEEITRIVKELHHRIAVIYGDRLLGVYLYGSYARDEARDDSDIDVAVVISGITDRWMERDKIGDITADISLRNDCLLTAFVMSEDEKNNKPFTIHRNIVREGISL